MTVRITALAAALALAAAPAMAATHHASMSSTDNMADQLNATSLSDTNAGKSYTPTHIAETHSEMGGRGMRGHEMRHGIAGNSQEVSPASGASTALSHGQGSALARKGQIPENGGTQVQPAPK